MVLFNKYFKNKKSVGFWRIRHYFSIKIFPKDLTGFTLIELIITIGVLTIGILGSFSLAIANSNNNKANKDRVIAGNLAREGLELVRNIRDSNWLRLDSNISCDGGATICSFDSRSLEDRFILVDYNNYSEGVSICAAYSSLEECLNNCRNDNSCLLYIDGQTFYSHDNSGISTNFYRVVHIRSICLDASGALPVEYVRDTCQVSEEKVGIQAIVRIDWNRTGKLYNLELMDKFYNWRR